MQVHLNVEIRKLNESNLPVFKQLVSLFNDVFENGLSESAGDDYLIKLLSNKDFIAIAAFAGDTVIGGLTAYELRAYYGNYSEVYIFDIAVKQEYQRKGIGNKLIDSLKEYCSLNNIKTVFVDAEEQDINAVNFYHKTKASSLKVIHFEYKLNK